MSGRGHPSALRAGWWACGVDEAIMGDPDCPTSEQVRFAAFGTFIWLATAGALVAGWMTAMQVLLPGPGGTLRSVLRAALSAPFAAFFALFVLNLLRLSVGLAGRRTDRIVPLSLDGLRAAAILVITGTLAVAVAAPLQVALVERDVQAGILVEEQAGALERARLSDASQLDADAPVPAARRLEGPAALRESSGFFRKVGFAYATNRVLCAALLAAVWLLFALPPVIRLFTDRGPYDFLVMHRNRALLAAAGVEPEAFTLHAPDGTPRLVDAFHVPRAVHQSSLAAVLERRRRDTADLAARQSGSKGD